MCKWPGVAEGECGVGTGVGWGWWPSFFLRAFDVYSERPFQFMCCLASDLCGCTVLFQAGLKSRTMKDRHFLCERGCCGHLVCAQPPLSWQCVDGRGLAKRGGDPWPKEL